MNIKDKKIYLLIINMNKFNVTYNHLIDYKTYTLINGNYHLLRWLSRYESYTHMI